MSDKKKAKMIEVNFGKPTKTVRLNPLDYVESGIKESLIQIREEQGLEASFQALAELVSEDMKVTMEDLTNLK